MGYTTDFEGSFKVTCRDSDEPGLRGVHAAYLRAFAETRHMKRDAEKCATQDDPVRKKANLPIGPGGGYCVGLPESDYAGVLDHNHPPAGLPGLWCKWVPTDDGLEIEWSGEEKFYDYVEWLQYLVDHFLTPWGYRLDGKVEWSGEEAGNLGRIEVDDSVVVAKRARVVYD